MRISYSVRARQKSGKLKYIVILLLILVVIGIVLYIHFVVSPLVNNVVRAKVYALASEVVADTAEVFKESPEFLLEFVEYEKNDEGYVTIVNGNSFNINQANFLIQREVQRRLAKLSNTTVGVPAGAFLGSTLLAAKETNQVDVAIVPIGSVQCEFCSEFLSKAVNQTLHRLYINVTMSISLALPLKTVSIETENQIFISETIIVGQIPSTYFESGFDTNLLDLVP